MSTQGRSASNLAHKITWVIGALVLLSLIVFIYTIISTAPTAFRPTMPPTGASTNPLPAGHLASAGPLVVRGCLVMNPKSNQVVLEIENNSRTAISNIKITKAQLGHQSVLNPTLPIVVKSLRGRRVHTVILEFPASTSRHLELELEFQGGILSGGSGSVSCGADLPLCSSPTSTNP